MAFVNLSLVLGTLLIGIPILLHLVMRQKPKQLIFPAIQFIQKRQVSNRRTLRLRHWLLLFLRCLAIALAALALARPSVSSNLFGNWIVIAALALLLLLVMVLLAVGLFTGQGKLVLASLGSIGAVVFAVLIALLTATLRNSDASLIGDREAPVAAVMVLDSSPRMQYRRDNATRLERAQEMANWMIGQLPSDSSVGVLDSRAITPVFSIDLAAARKTIQRVRTTGAPKRLDQLIEAAIQLAAQSQLKRKEIYLYTDLSTAAWQTDDSQRLRNMMEQAENVALYIIDVGVEEPENYWLGPLKLSSEVVPENSILKVETTISCIGKGGKRSIQLLVEDLDPSLPLIRDDEVVLPKSRLRIQQDVELTPNESQKVEFPIASLELGTRHARLQIVEQDALLIDNTRYLSALVRPPWLVLVVAPQEVNTSGFVEAIAPYEHRMENRASYECLVVTPEEITNHSLDDFASVVLLDPTPISNTAWEQLGTYVREGGQLALFLGHSAKDAETFNASEAVALLPGKLNRQYRVPGGDVYLAPNSYEHPILRAFQDIASSVPWSDFPVFRHWSLQDIAPDAQIIMRFGNNQPAMLERQVERGTVLMMTTPITELERPDKRQAWNELAGPGDWPRFILINELMRFLTLHDAGEFNFLTGQSVVLSNPTQHEATRYLLFSPEGDPQPIQARGNIVTINTTDNPGVYRLKGDREHPTARGFSVNLSEHASLLTRIEPEVLDQLLGEHRYELARDREQIVRVQGRQRTGREFFPFLMALLAITLILEQLLANRFYRDTGPNG